MSVTWDQGGILRPDIARGWRRSALSGLDQGMEVREPALVEFDKHSQLQTVAEPVLAKLADDLVDTSFSVLLADSSARIVDRRVGNTTSAKLLEQVKAIPGALYVEEVSGTNSLATAYETKKPISVTGPEHFLEALRVFTCYGAPVIHPLTGKLAGVLDITGSAEQGNDLLKPVLLRAVSDIEQRLFAGAKLSEQNLFAEFRLRASHSRSAVMAFGRDLFIDNNLARDILSDFDRAQIRSLIDDRTDVDHFMHEIQLSSGTTAKIVVDIVSKKYQSAIVEVRVSKARRVSESTWESTQKVTMRGAGGAESPGIFVVTGEPGTGKSTRALDLAASLTRQSSSATETDLVYGDIQVLDCAALLAGHSRVGSLEIGKVFANSQAVVVDNVQLLLADVAEYLRHIVSRHPYPVVLVGTGLDHPLDACRPLISLAVKQEILPPLRDVKEDFAHIVDQALAQITRSNRKSKGASGSDLNQGLRAVPSVLDVLRTQPWPGNRTELTAVLEEASGGRHVGDITLNDLPKTHRYRVGQTRHLSLLERAERDAIVQALSNADSNKSKAASELGIGRTTLYNRLRYFRIES